MQISEVDIEGKAAIVEFTEAEAKGIISMANQLDKSIADTIKGIIDCGMKGYMLIVGEG